MESTLAETQAALESWEKRALISESREERQNREISILRKQVADLQTVQLENENLVKIVREMKKSLGGSGPSPHPQIGHSMSGEAEKEVSEGDRTLLKKIQQESMLIVDRDTFRKLLHFLSLSSLVEYILRQSETHERSLLSASQHLTVFDSDLKLQKRRSLFLQNILSNYQLVVCTTSMLSSRLITSRDASKIYCSARSSIC